VSPLVGSETKPSIDNIELILIAHINPLLNKVS